MSARVYLLICLRSRLAVACAANDRSEWVLVLVKRQTSKPICATQKLPSPLSLVIRHNPKDRAKELIDCIAPSTLLNVVPDVGNFSKPSPEAIGLTGLLQGE